jgi:hypothetical protein
VEKNSCGHKPGVVLFYCFLKSFLFLLACTISAYRWPYNLSTATFYYVSIKQQHGGKVDRWMQVSNRFG